MESMCLLTLTNTKEIFKKGLNMDLVDTFGEQVSNLQMLSSTEMYSREAS